MRAHGDALACRVSSPDQDSLLIELDEPVRGIAPGQAVVVYDGDRVVGSATIAHARTVSALGAGVS